MSELNLPVKVVDQFSGPLAKLKQQLASVKSPSGLGQIRKDFDGLHQSASRAAGVISGSLSSSLAGLGVAGVAAGLGLGAVASAIKGYGDNISNLKRLNQETGISLNTMRALGQAAPYFGVAADQMMNALQGFATNAHDFLRKRGDMWTTLFSVAPNFAANMEKSLRDGGVNAGLDKAIGFILQERERNPQNAKRLSQIIFGTDISALGARGITEFRSRIQKVMADQKPLSPQDINDAEKLSDTIQDLQRAFSNLGDTLVRAVVPHLIPLIDKLATFVKENEDGMATWIRDLADYFEKADWKRVAKDVGEVADAFKSAFRNARELLELGDRINNFIMRPWQDPAVKNYLGTDDEGRKKKIQDSQSAIEALRNGPNANKPETKARIDYFENLIRRLQKELEDGVQKGSEEGVKRGLLGFNGGGGIGGGIGGNPLLQNASYGGAPFSLRGGAGGRRSLGGFSEPDEPRSDSATQPSNSGVRRGGNGDARGAVPDGPSGGRGGDARLPAGMRERGQRVYSRLRSLGWTHEAASAAVGQAELESGIGAKTNPGEGAAGLIHWRLDRLARLKKMAASRGEKGIGSLETQADFLNWETRHGKQSQTGHLIPEETNRDKIAARFKSFIRYGTQTTLDREKLGMKWGQTLRDVREAAKDSPAVSKPAYPEKWGLNGAYDAARGAGVVSGPGNSDAKGRLDMYVHGLPGSFRARAEMGSLFKDVNVNRGKNMISAKDDE